MTWTQSKIDQMLDLWSLGYSATQIAEKIDLPSRNAVVGKIRRLRMRGMDIAWRQTSGINRRRGECLPNSRRWQAYDRRTYRPEPQEQVQRSPVLKILARQPINRPSPNLGNVLFVEAQSHQCRFMSAHPRDLPIEQVLVCGETVQAGSSYCPDHHGQLYEKHSVRKERMRKGES